MNIKQLQYFVGICEKKNLTAVAKDFYISQQGLSSALKKMEEELGMGLFTRTSKGAFPNECAEMILPHARLITQEYQLMETKINSKKNDVSGHFNLHVNRIFLDILPVGTEAKLQNAFPNIFPDVEDMAEVKALENIDNETADLALVSGPVDPKKYTRKILNAYPYIAVVKRDSPLAGRDVIYVKDLKDEQIMIMSEAANMHRNFVEKCEENGFHPNLYLLASDAMHLLALCSDTNGVGISSAFYGEYFPDHLVTKIPIGDEGFLWTIEFAYKKGRKIGSHVKVWLDFFMRLAHEYFRAPGSK